MMSRRGGQTPRRQHYVSQVLLSQFSGAAVTRKAGICQIGVSDGRTYDPKSAKSMGFEWLMFKHKPDWMEKLWQTVEDPMGNVNSILADGRPESLEGHRNAITDFVALHFARSLEAKRIHLDSYEQMERQARANRGMQLTLAKARYPMLDLALAPSVLDGMAEVVLEPIKALEATGSLFQEFVESAFARTRQRLADYGLSIRPAASGSEYLLGDCPAVGLADGMNPRRRPPLFAAKALIMPLSTRFAAMIYPRGAEDPAFSVDPGDPDVVRAINHGQIAQAHNRVFYRPDSGHEATVRRYLGLE